MSSSPTTTGPSSTSAQPARVATRVLLGVTLWRLLIAAFGAIGFADAVDNSDGFGDAIQALSQQASLWVAVVFLVLALYPLFTRGRAHEPRTPWWRGAMAVLLLLVGITFQTLLSGDLDTVQSLFEHALTPIVVVLDWLLIGRNQASGKWWHPLTWAIIPAAYLVFFMIVEPDLYGSFLNPGESSFPGTVIAFLLAVILAGYLLYSIGRLKAAASRRFRPGAQQQTDVARAGNTELP